MMLNDIYGCHIVYHVCEWYIVRDVPVLVPFLYFPHPFFCPTDDINQHSIHLAYCESDHHHHHHFSVLQCRVRAVLDLLSQPAQYQLSAKQCSSVTESILFHGEQSIKYITHLQSLLFECCACFIH